LTSNDPKKRKLFLLSYKVITILIIVWMFSMLVLSFFDLEISKAVVNFSSSTGKFVQHFGGVPGMVFAEFAFFLLAGSLETSGRIITVSILGLFTVICAAIPYFSFKTFFFSIKFLRGFFEDHKMIIFIFFVFISIIVLAFFRTVLKDLCVKKRNFSLIVVKIFVVSYAIVTTILKYASGRIRFKDLGEGFLGFTPWYIFNGPNGNFSFPSGHTVLGWMLLPAILLVSGKRRNLKIAVAIPLIAWGIFVSVNRVIYGTHYASDVLFSTGITIILFLLFLKNSRDSDRPLK